MAHFHMCIPTCKNGEREARADYFPLQIPPGSSLHNFHPHSKGIKDSHLAPMEGGEHSLSGGSPVPR